MSYQLYRHFDHNDELLYIGISLSALSRLSSHMSVSHWAETITKVTIEKHPTKQDALRAEREAIKNEKPKHNIIHKPTIAEEEAAAADISKRVEKERISLLNQVVNIDPVYRIDELGQVLKFGPTSVKRMINSGEIGHITIPYGSRVKTLITGWQLIDYLENKGGM